MIDCSKTLSLSTRITITAEKILSPIHEGSGSRKVYNDAFCLVIIIIKEDIPRSTRVIMASFTQQCHSSSFQRVKTHDEMKRENSRNKRCANFKNRT